MSQSPRERIDMANQSMSITAACRFIGMPLGDFAIASVKTYCPFGEIMHDDGGRGKAFRVYPETNSAWCFACNVYYTSVKLIATDRDVTDLEAAEIILEEVGYVAPDYQTRWQAQMEKVPDVDHDALTQALKTACARMDRNWADRQFEDRISAKLAQCLGLLYKVATEEEARAWLDITKKAMRQTLQAVPA